MKWRDTLKISARALKTNKSRSALTILGIVIGVSAVIGVMSISQGAKALILDQIKSIGPDIVVVRPGREPRGPASMAKTILSNSLKNRDIELLKKKVNVPDLEDIAPAVFVPLNLSYRGDTYTQAMVLGWKADWVSRIFNIYPNQGRLFDENDIKSHAKVAILGNKVAEEFFGEGQALDKKISIGSKKFKVIATLPPKGQVSIFDIDNIVIIPYTTAQKDLMGINYYSEVLLKAKNEKVVPQMVEDIKRVLRQSHHISSPDKDDFFVATQSNMADMVGIITAALTFLLASVAAISLIVGGVGVMNIMLTSVTERTKEIGLRKAVGATKKDILQQFLFEAVLLTGTGGFIGIVLGVSFSALTSAALTRFANLSWPFVFPFGGILLGVGVSTLIGLVFGLYPARQAAKKSPVEALRYE